MVDSEVLKQTVTASPAFIIDETEIISALTTITDLCNISGCKLLYSIKSLPLMSVLALIKPYVDGFSVSSLFEARLAAEISNGQGSIHLTTPGIRPDEVNELVSLCSHISCNSFNQYNQIAAIAHLPVSLGIRVNPGLSFTQDARHDPCRLHSKLGVGRDVLLNTEVIKEIKGFHIHNVFSESDYLPLTKTIARIRSDFGDHLDQLDWINLGGGYLFNAIDEHGIFVEMASQLINDFGVDVFIEPGNDIVGKAGYLLATVIDSFESDGKTVAILDTSVNHLPRVFEYQQQPVLAEHDGHGKYSAILAGSTCLAGDLFGEYRFNQPLVIGDKVVFNEVGAYSLVKANRFNGYNLPEIYLINGGHSRQIKRYSYEDYRQQWA
ncbi:carboxynorspermidine decarboxylase [biofilm metagenome]